MDSMEDSIVTAKKFLEDILAFFGLNCDVYATGDGEIIQLDIPSTHLNGFLIGQRGDTLRSMQFLVSQSLKSSGQTYNRVNIDVAGYKKQRANHLLQRADEWIKTVQDSGDSKELQPMNAAERRLVHKAAQEAGITSESVGEGRDRHIVLHPADKTQND